MPAPNFQIITPENINSITFQYRIQASRTTIPSIFVTYGDTRKATINLAEVLPYIGYLRIKAALLGQAVIATQFTDNKTVISIGEPVPISTIDVFTFKLDGVDFAAPQALTDILNGAVTLNKVYTTGFVPAIVQFTLPVLTDGNTPLDQEYNLPVIADTFFTGTNDGTNWTVLMTTFNTVPYIGDVAITSNSFIKFVNTGFGGSGILLFDDNFNPSVGINVVTYQYLKRDTNYYPALVDANGGMTVIQKAGVTVISTVYCQPTDYPTITPLNDTITEIELQRVALRLTNNAAKAVFVTFGNIPNKTGFSFANSVFFNNDSNVKFSGNIQYCLGANNAANTFYMDIYRNGVVIQSEPLVVNDNVNTVTVDAGNEDYDKIVINEVAAGMGIPISLQAANGNPCAAGLVTYYINHAGSIVPTDVVYTDAALTTPLAGATQIVDPNTNTIYAIDIVTGVVGAATGNSCFVNPQTGEVINNAGSGVPASQITNVSVNTFILAGLSFPVFGGQDKTGTYDPTTGVNNITFTATQGTTVPTIVRITDSNGINHDQAWHGNDTYTFLNINSGTGFIARLI